MRLVSDQPKEGAPISAGGGDGTQPQHLDDGAEKCRVVDFRIERHDDPPLAEALDRVPLDL